MLALNVSTMFKNETSETLKMSLMKAVVRTGILRHIHAILDQNIDPLLIDKLDDYTKSKLIEWIICCDFAIIKMSLMRQINIDNALEVTLWYDECEFFTSKISTKGRYSWYLHLHFLEDVILPRIIKRLDMCASSCKSNEKLKVIEWLLDKLLKIMEANDPNVKWSPISVWGAAECSQALYINEFDYVLLRKQSVNLETSKEKLIKRLNIAVLELNEVEQHSFLALESMVLDIFYHMYLSMFPHTLD